MKFWLSLMALLTLSACHPADVNVKSARERLDEGEIIEYTEPGAMRENCRTDRPAWDNIRLTEQNRKQVVLGKTISVLSPGRLACYKVGSEVRMVEMRNEKFEGGRAIVTRIAVVKLEKLQARHLKGQVWATNASVEREKTFFAEKLKPDNGIVTITDLQYIAQSAADEKALHEQEKKPEQPGGMEQTEKDGDKLPSDCTGQWRDITIDPAYQEDLLKNRLGSWYQLGYKNCFTQGQEVNIKTSFDRNTPPIAKLKIFKIKRLSKHQIQREHFVTAQEFNFEKLKAKIAGEKARDNTDFITIMDVATDKPVDSRECNPSLTVQNVDKTSGGLLTVEIVGAACARDGDVIELDMIQENGGHKAIPARVVGRHFNKEKYTTTLLLEPLGDLP